MFKIEDRKYTGLQKKFVTNTTLFSGAYMGYFVLFSNNCLSTVVWSEAGVLILDGLISGLGWLFIRGTDVRQILGTDEYPENKIESGL